MSNDESKSHNFKIVYILGAIIKKIIIKTLTEPDDGLYRQKRMRPRTQLCVTSLELPMGNKVVSTC